MLELTEVVREDGEVIELERAMAQPQSSEGYRLEAVPDEPARDEPDPGEQVAAGAGDEPAALPGDPPTAIWPPAEEHADDHLPQSPMDIRDNEMEDHQTAMQKRNGLETLVSDRAAGAATGAFAKLSQAVQRTPPEVAIADGDGRSIEQFIEDMMRPMLRDWLDAEPAADGRADRAEGDPEDRAPRRGRLGFPSRSLAADPARPGPLRPLRPGRHTGSAGAAVS